MSIDFYAAYKHEGEELFKHSEINMCNGNASEFFSWLGLGHVSLWDEPPMKASALAPLCRRKTWGGVERNKDHGRPWQQEGDRVINGARHPGSFEKRVRQLLKFCEKAIALDPEATIYWG